VGGEIKKNKNKKNGYNTHKMVIYVCICTVSMDTQIQRNEQTEIH